MLLRIVPLLFWMWMDHSMTAFAKGYAPHRARLARRFIWLQSGYFSGDPPSLYHPARYQS